MPEGPTTHKYLFQEDELGAALHSSGAKTPEVDRLGKIAAGMQHLEWKLARSAAMGRALTDTTS